jgi:hypothetical protein
MLSIVRVEGNVIYVASAERKSQEARPPERDYILQFWRHGPCAGCYAIVDRTSGTIIYCTRHFRRANYVFELMVQGEI